MNVNESERIRTNLVCSFVVKNNLIAYLIRKRQKLV